MPSFVGGVFFSAFTGSSPTFQLLSAFLCLQHHETLPVRQLTNRPSRPFSFLNRQKGASPIPSDSSAFFPCGRRRKKSFQSHHLSLCQQFNCSLSNHRFSAGSPIHTAFSTSLEPQNISVCARSGFLKRPISLVEQTIFITILTQNIQFLDAGDNGDSAEDTVPLRLIYLPLGQKDVARAARASALLLARDGTGHKRNQRPRRGRLTPGGSHPGTFLC